MLNLICELSATSLKTPVTCKGNPFIVSTLSSALLFPKYFLAVLSEITIVLGFINAVLGSPVTKGKENIVRKEASAINHLSSLKIFVFPFSSVYHMAEVGKKMSGLAKRAKSITSGKSAFIAGATAGCVHAFGPVKLPEKTIGTRYILLAFL